MAAVVYCTTADLLLPADALAELQPTDIARAIAAASGEADAYLSTRWDLPLTQPADGWPPALVNAVAQMATYRAMLMRGYAPQAGQNDTVQQGYKDAKAFLKDVSKGDATLQMLGANSDAVTQEGGGPSSNAYVLQAEPGSGSQYDAEEDFWHDRPSARGGGASPRKRGW